MNTHFANFVGKTVLLKLSSGFIAECGALLQPHHKVTAVYARVQAIDALGLWVENPHWETTSASTNQKSEHKAHIFIPWGAIQTAVAFPERVFDGVPNEVAAKGFGFHVGPSP